MKLTNEWSKFNIYLFVGVWSFSSRRKSRLGCLYHRQQGSYLRVEVSSSYNFLAHFSLSPLRVASLAWRWFSRALAFRSFYHPWGKMGTTRSLKQLRLWGPQKVRDTGDPGQKKTTRLQLIYTRTLDSRGLEWDSSSLGPRNVRPVFPPLGRRERDRKFSSIRYRPIKAVCYHAL